MLLRLFERVMRVVGYCLLTFLCSSFCSNTLYNFNGLKYGNIKYKNINSTPINIIKCISKLKLIYFISSWLTLIIPNNKGIIIKINIIIINTTNIIKHVLLVELFCSFICCVFVETTCGNL